MNAIITVTSWYKEKLIVVLTFIWDFNRVQSELFMYNHNDH